MGRWTDLQKEMNGHKRRLANRKNKVSLKVAPWENKDESDRDNGSGTSKRTEKKVREST